MLTAANMKQVTQQISASHSDEQLSIVISMTDLLVKAENLLHNTVLSTIAAAVVQVVRTDTLLTCFTLLSHVGKGLCHLTGNFYHATDSYPTESPSLLSECREAKRRPLV